MVNEGLRWRSHCPKPEPIDGELNMNAPMSLAFFDEIAASFQAPVSKRTIANISIEATDNLASWFDVSDLAVATIGIAGVRLAEYASSNKITPPAVSVDRRLASLWFDMTLRPHGWEIPSPWDPLAGDYRSKDGWIRLHTNAPHHRDAALSVLGNAADRTALAPIVAKWSGADLEQAIVEAKGCAAEMRSLEDWANHPQGMAVANEPLITWAHHGSMEPHKRSNIPARPLAGIRVLDLTRVLAGPVAGRFLAAYGANVLRVDPPGWDEPGVIPEVTLGKRCAGLDLNSPDDRAIFEALLADADVFLHGYRPDALNNLGYDRESLNKLNPRLIDISLNAYGWSGPWSGRRGFDSLMQMSCGIADYGMKMSGAEKPVPLPVQALDHATGYLMAVAALHALHRRNISGEIVSAKMSLARTAHLLAQTKRATLSEAMAKKSDGDFDTAIENTGWGPAHRIKFPLAIEGMPHHWNYPAGPLRSANAVWE